jgi:hypothetical protein
VEHRAQVAGLLLVRAVRDEARPEHPDADDVEDPGHAAPADLLVDDDLLDRPEALAADLLGPRSARPSPASASLPCQARRASM